MATNNTNPLHSKLEAPYSAMQSLKPNSSSKDFNVFGAFFDRDCSVYLKSMREHADPSIGRQAAVDTLKEILAEYFIEEQRVLSHATSDDGSTVIVEMKNRLNVSGGTIDPFYETAIAVYNNAGLITGLKTYSCRSYIVGIIQDKTGNGPYAR